MKDLKLLVWISQLGLSVAAPLAGFVLIGVWLDRAWSTGPWLTIAGVVVGLICAVDGFRSSMRAMERMAGKDKTRKDEPFFNDHE